jgi:ABC-type multidrug transport system fused ATPase/permease subunit
VRNQFEGTTIFTVAHRLETIIDYEKVMVLSFGEISEFGTPKELVAQESGIFSSMVEESPQAQRLKEAASTGSSPI